MSIKDDMEDVQEAVINELISDNGLNPLTVGDLQITTAKIADDAVTLAKLGSDVNLGQVNDGAVTPAKLSQSYLPLTGGSVSGSLTTTGQTINNANQSQSALSIGGSSTNAALVLRGSPSSASAWQISSNAYVASALEFTRSTAVGGTTFSTPSMTLDASGNVLVNGIVTNPAYSNTSNQISLRGSVGTIEASRDGGAPLELNRKTSDGAIVVFRKDGGLVGSIGTLGGDMVLGTGDVGVRFDDGSDVITPWNTSTNAARDNAIDLGHGTARFDDIYATNGTIQTSDRNEKQDIEELSEAEQRVAVACKGLLRKFRWKSSVEENGEEARIHFGIIAQDLQAAFEAEGLDAGRYAMFISSTWTDEETEEKKTRLGVRYSELLAFIISAI